MCWKLPRRFERFAVLNPSNFKFFIDQEDLYHVYNLDLHFYIFPLKQTVNKPNHIPILEVFTQSLPGQPPIFS